MAVEDIKIKAQQMVDELTDDRKYQPENYEYNCNDNQYMNSSAQSTAGD